MNLNRLVTAACRRGPRVGACAARLALLGLLAVIGGLETTPVLAAEATISARYRGDASGKFENTTPLAGFCGRWPSHCNGVETVGLPLTYTKKTVKLAADARDRFYIQLPGQRTVEVAHQETGERYRLTFEITSISQRVNGAGTANPVFTATVRGGCSYQRTHGVSGFVVYLWSVRNSVSPTGCFSDGDGGSAGDTRVSPVLEMGIAYRLSMPSALKMKQGLYRGSLNFSVGPGAYFDFGNEVIDLNSNNLTINFELDVQHAFVLAFAPGSDRAVLEPPGGWLQWLSGGQAPQRLYRDLPFRLWSTGPFKVYKHCQYDVAERCGIRNTSNDEVPLTVGLSLPVGIEHGGKPVNRLEIPTGRESALAFESMMPALDRPGQLHFQVGREDVRGMLAHPGSTYQGQVTVIFDADL